MLHLTRTRLADATMSLRGTRPGPNLAIHSTISSARCAAGCAARGVCAGAPQRERAHTLAAPCVRAAELEHSTPPQTHLPPRVCGWPSARARLCTLPCAASISLTAVKYSPLARSYTLRQNSGYACAGWRGSGVRAQGGRPWRRWERLRGIVCPGLCRPWQQRVRRWGRHCAGVAARERRSRAAARRARSRQSRPRATRGATGGRSQGASPGSSWRCASRSPQSRCPVGKGVGRVTGVGRSQ